MCQRWECELVPQVPHPRAPATAARPIARTDCPTSRLAVLAELTTPCIGLLFVSQLVFSLKNTMPVTKFAISVPKETMGQVDRAAKRLGLTRSRYISTVLARIAERERNAAIAKKVDEVLAEMDEQDLESAKHLRRARHDSGTEW